MKTASGVLAAEVVVVGGGPAGSSAAWHLSRAGFDVVLLDRAHFPRDKPCAEYLSPQASRILDAMGALGPIEAAGAAQLAGMRVFAANGASIHGEFAADHGWRGFRDRGLALRRTVLDALLLDRARVAGVRVIEGTRVTDLTRDDDGRVAGVRGLSPGGAPLAVTARLTVGADGLRSVVARRLGVARVARWPRRVALVAHYRGVRGMGDCGEIHMSGAAEYAGLADVGGGVTNVAVVVPATRAGDLRGNTTAFFEHWLAMHPALAPRLDGAERIAPVRAIGPLAVRASHAVMPGVALAGDAADFCDPVTGEGIYSALRGGEMVAEHASAMLALPPGRAADAALARYGAARRREFGGKWIVERLAAAAVAWPGLTNRVARVLARRKDMADLVVGVAGDFVPPRALLRPRFLLPLLLGTISSP